MKEADGGVREPPRPCTRAKYMGQCREMIGVTMIEGDDGKLKGVRIAPFNYTKQTVVGPVAFEKAVQAEVRRVGALKTTGTNSSLHWKDAGEGLPGGAYQAKYGDGWRQAVSDKLGKGRSKALCYVTRLMKHAIQEGNRIFKGTEFENNWVMYHDALSSWWSVGAQEFMRGEDFEDRQIRGLGHTNQDNRYGGKLPGDTPEYMPLDSNCFPI